jgi:hypothetical protein
VLPRLTFPVAPAINSHVETAHREALEWVAEHDMLDADKLERLDQARVGWITARTNPHVPAESLRLVTDWYLWLYSMDDGYCDESDMGARAAEMMQMASRLSRVLADPTFPLEGAGRCAGGLRDIRRRVAALASPSQLARWSEAVNGYLMGICWEAANRETGRPPSLPEYTAMRPLSGGVWTAFLLMDVAAGYELQHEQLTSPGFRELADVAVDLINWDNDMYSYAKETLDHGAMHNIVRALADHHECSVDEALQRFAAIHDEWVDRFFALEARLAPTLTPEGKRFTNGMKDWIRGSMDYSAASPRFKLAPSPIPSGDLSPNPSNSTDRCACRS